MKANNNPIFLRFNNISDSLFFGNAMINECLRRIPKSDSKGLCDICDILQDLQNDQKYRFNSKILGVLKVALKSPKNNFKSLTKISKLSNNIATDAKNIDDFPIYETALNIVIDIKETRKNKKLSTVLSNNNNNTK